MNNSRLITFPYPYMNGPLHLGHAYTLLSADIIARYYTSIGEDVIFPLGFHGSGMPIVSCADKIKEGDLHQKDIMKKMDIPEDKIYKFKDPYYWIKYFPKRAKEDLKVFNTSIDFSRSFITTDLNPYYDSFVRWHFNKLYNKGIVFKATKPVIYSTKTQQPCADHDRSLGEGANIITEQLSKYTFGDIIILSESKPTPNNGILFRYDGILYFTTTGLYDILKYQYNVTEPEKYTIKDTDLPILEKIGEFNYYTTDKRVVSRLGDECIVAVVEQWFIDYDYKDTTDIINDYIRNNIDVDDITRNNLIDGSDWLKYWPCSRSAGIGTKLLDTEYLIDSLSDSTIYMAYYTIAHLINKISIKDVNDAFWDYIFLGKGDLSPTDLSQTDLMIEMRNEFLHRYPVDLRVSGKDLVKNHMVMCLYNHYYIWEDINMLPKSYIINGHITINKEKMSKSKGNFMTLRQAVDRYTADATRIALVEAGAGYGDANFSEKGALIAKQKLDMELRWCTDMYDKIKNIDKIQELTYWDKIFSNDINAIMNEIHDHINNRRLQAVKHASFNKLYKARDDYMRLVKKGYIVVNRSVMEKWLMYHIVASKPICPGYAEQLMKYTSYNDIWPKDTDYSLKLSAFKEQIDNLIKRCKSTYNKNIRKGKDVTITLYRFNYNFIKLLYDIRDGTANYNKKFEKDMEKYIHKYGKEWVDWYVEDDGISFAKEWLPKLIGINKEKIFINDNVGELQIRYYPFNPHVRVLRKT